MATVGGLTAGETYFFYVTARNELGLESGPSAEISYRVPGPATNTPPSADSASIGAEEDVPVPVVLSGSDADGQSITFGIVSTPLHGELSGVPPLLTYVPAVNFFGTDSFTFEVSDGISNSAPATVVITVNPANDSPTLDVIPNQIIGTNAGVQTVVLTGIGSGAENENATLTLTAFSSDPLVIPHPTITYVSPAATAVLAYSAEADARGTVTITVRVDDGHTNNSTFSRRFDVVIGIDSTPTFYLQAEAGELRSPMAIGEDTGAANGLYVWTKVSQQGTITFPVVVPQTDDYAIWCRVLSTNGGTDSFFVSVDGGPEDIYDTAEGIWSPRWQWTQVNGRSSGGSRILTLNQGAHSLVFRGREAATRLDAICITTDLNFVPLNSDSNPPVPPQLLNPRIVPQGGVAVRFQAPGESRYEFQASPDFLWWSPLWQSPAATTNEWIEFVDLDVTRSSSKFYRVLVLPH